MVAEDDAMRISKVVLEDLAGKLQWFAVVYRVLVGFVVIAVVLPDNAEPVQYCGRRSIYNVHETRKW